MLIKNKTYLILPILFLSIAFILQKYFVINITPSMKKGIYLKLSGDIKQGDIVLLYPPKNTTYIPIT
jgi:type IV secretory pathway protease TraF